MTTTINASPSNGIVQTADGSGVLKVQSNGVTTNSLAWVNWNGGSGNTAGVINASYNVSSITVNGTGDYTVNFASALSSASYAWSATMARTNTINTAQASISAPTASAIRIQTTDSTGGLVNGVTASVVIHGN